MSARLVTRMVAASAVATTVGLFAFTGCQPATDVLTTNADRVLELGAPVTVGGDVDVEIGADGQPVVDPDDTVLDVSQPGRPDALAMVGDSLTVGATPMLQEEFAILGIDVVAIDAQVGRRMDVRSGSLDSGTETIEDVEAAADPGLWVVALGTNDVGKYATDDEYLAQIEAVLDEIPADVPVVWIDTWLRDAADEAARFNELLRDRLDRRDDTLVVDWYRFGDEEGVISGDGVHPTPTGAQVFAEVVSLGVATLVTSL